MDYQSGIRNFILEFCFRFHDSSPGSLPAQCCIARSHSIYEYIWLKGNMTERS